MAVVVAAVAVAAVAGAADGNHAVMRGPSVTDEDGTETGQEAADAEDEANAGVEREVEAEEDARGSSSDDPLGAYLRTMTSFSLLTREGEIAIAKRIEEGKRRVLEVVTGCGRRHAWIIPSLPGRTGRGTPRGRRAVSSSEAARSSAA